MSEHIELQIRDAYKHQKHSKCVELIDSLPSKINETSQYRILKASCLNNISGRSSEAFLILESVIQTDPQNPLALFGKGLVCINEGKFQEAVQCFSNAIELEPSEKMDKARAMKARAENMLLSLKAKKRDPPKTADISTCNVCHKSFTKNFSLMRHMLLHTGERPFSCKICNYGFIQKSDLLRHEATHKAEFNFHCMYCTKKFKTKKNLQCHLATHKTDRPYPCPHCPKTFKLPRLLRFHVGTHRNTKEFQCDICSKSFAKKPYISAHMKTCHLRDEKKNAPRPEQIEEELDFSQDIIVKEEPQFSEQVIYEEPINIIQEPISIKEEPSEEETSNMSFEESDESSRISDVAYAPIIDPDMEFFRLLIRDVKRMDEKQKEQFRRKTRAVINEILN
jgi:tetratricopeptide (TPR) repeat protein